MGILFLHKEVPAWLERVAESIQTSVEPFDARGVTSRAEPVVVLLDARGGEELAACRNARTGFGDEVVLIAITESGEVDPEVRRFIDGSVPPSERALVSLLPVALQLASERRARRNAESQVAHLRRPQAQPSSPGFALTNAAFTRARMGVLQVDRAGRCIVWNRFMELRTGVLAADVLGKPLSCHPALVDLGFAEIPERALGGETVDAGEIHVRDPVSGRGLYLHAIASPIADEAGVTVSAVAVVHDRTPQRIAEELRRKAETGFRSLLDALPDLAVVLRDGRVVYANALVTKLCGFATELEVVDLPIEDALLAQDPEAVVAHLAAIERGEPRPPIDVVARFADQSSHVLELLCVPVQFDGQPAILCVGRDVTERKLLQAQLAATDRLASMGMLAAGVAHEINNPLTALVSSLDFLNEALEAHPALAADADFVDLLLTSQEATGRVREIVRDLKLFSRPDEERRGAVDLAAALESTVRLARGEIRHKAKLVKEYHETPTVDGNAARLGQVLLNLVMNAAQAIPEGETDRHEIGLKTCQDDEGNAVVEVRDTGRGIPPEDLPRIFEPFFSTKPIGVGTGLGLAVCQRIISAMAGRIEVQSALGQGSTFRVVLPPSKRRFSTQTPPRLLTPLPARRGRILVVDDDVAVRRTLTRILVSEHDIVTVGSGVEAIEMVAEGERFDVVLCDLMMPRVSGDQCWARVAEIAPDLAARFVFVTGGAMATTSRAFLENTLCPTVDKPFDAETLRRAVREVMRMEDAA